ncbi:hypothetical protein MmTuc01_3028 [Methanosarcina mazei Tuc01]|jgi:hypothetical protein|uniref:Uncharacterized protein n=1 Tax=Methanosarcina mazei Tuc01 TaxID=1236903 RepID=M1PCN6_METMZ|nr:hypothetical protein MmTuc01_3028 [Methanosarcina mazei Tuc01]
MSEKIGLIWTNHVTAGFATTKNIKAGLIRMKIIQITSDSD